MADREKVIKGLTACVDGMCDDCPYYDEEVPDCDYYGRCNRIDLNRDALALLREQEPEIVRCKDCKHYDPYIQLCHNGLDGIFLPDWFCADGERR